MSQTGVHYNWSGLPKYFLYKKFKKTVTQLTISHEYFKKLYNPQAIEPKLAERSHELKKVLYEMSNKYYRGEVETRARFRLRKLRGQNLKQQDTGAHGKVNSACGRRAQIAKLVAS